MNKKTTLKRLSALFLALIMAVSLMPAAGASAGTQPKAPEQKAPFQITINGNQYTSKPSDAAVKDNNTLKSNLETRYWAYQIFTGELAEGSDGYQPGMDTDGNPNANQLSNPKWGASVTNIDSLVRELISRDNNTLAKDVGITFELMLATGDKYLKADSPSNLSNYKAAYTTSTNWEGDDIGGTLTEDGKTALKEAFEKDLERLNLGNLFSAATGWKDPEKNEAYGAESAADVVGVLSDFTNAHTGNAALAQAFTAILTQRNSDVGTTQNYKYLKNSYNTYVNGTSTSEGKYQGAYAVSSWDPETEKWYIGDNEQEDPVNENFLSAGYYLIRDAYQENYWYGGESWTSKPSDAIGNLDRANSEFIVAVFGSTEITVKSDAPGVEKSIVNFDKETGHNNAKGEDYEIGELILYRLTGKLPENYDTGYNEYYYAFHDKMDKGLSYLGKGASTADSDISKAQKYQDVLQVYIKVPAEEGEGLDDGDFNYYLIDLCKGDIPTTFGSGTISTGYYLEVTASGVDIVFPDLKSLEGTLVTAVDENGVFTPDDEPESVSLKDILTSNCEIYVEYYGYLNRDAALGTANVNKIQVEYANNPEWNRLTSTTKMPTGMSTADSAYSYTFGIDVFKYEKTNNDNIPRADAGFVLKKTVKENDEDVTYYGVFKGNAPNFTLAGWIKEDQLVTLVNSIFELNGDSAISEVADITETQWKELESRKPNEGKTVDDVAGPTQNQLGGIGVTAQELKAAGVSLSEAFADNRIKGDKDDSTSRFDTFEIVMKTKSAGHIVIKGVEDGEYALEEVFAPSGYDLIDGINIAVEFKAEYFTQEELDGAEEGKYPVDAKAGMLKSLQAIITYKGKDDAVTANWQELTGNTITQNIVMDGYWVEDDAEEGAVKHPANTALSGYEYVARLEVANYLSGYLPGTGGGGVYKFYIAGGLLLAGAALLLVLTNTKKKTPGKHAN